MAGFFEALRPGLRRTLILGILLSGLWRLDPSEAQIISPGKLSSVHGEMEGMGNCTQCHKLRIPGADPDRCLQCHQALDHRIEQGVGYHGRLEETDCGTCHKEHLGEEFNLIRMESDTFSHGLTGHLLEGAHEEVDCRTCHTPEFISDSEVRRELSRSDGLSRTYLGLGRTCGSCHGTDDPHESQFSPRDCATCHSQTEWDGAEGFNHDLTPYPLVDKHRDVDCSDCHVVEQRTGSTDLIRYAPLDASGCDSCHQDPHKTPMPGSCDGCHQATDWHRVERSSVESVFDHNTTDFLLEGAHGVLECRACHTQSQRSASTISLEFPNGSAGRTYPIPEHGSCTSCHLDSHEGVFEDRQCEVCHTQDSWAPPSFDRARHNVESAFDLTGAHAVTPCSECHEVASGTDPRLQFRFDEPNSCAVCHKSEDPHEGGFSETGCDLCHTSAVFSMSRFNHRQLDEAGWTGLCSGCHEADGPHGPQFPDRDCGDCHGTEEYRILEFNHQETRFPLDGAHTDVPCSSCHLPTDSHRGEPMVRYRPMDLSCTACHGGKA